MKIITAQEKLAALGPSCRLLQRCVQALEGSDHLGAVVKLEDGDREEDIDLVITALGVAGWRAETVAEYPPGAFTRSDTGDKLRIFQGLVSARRIEAKAGGGGGH
jgi:hypothetical protein